MVKVYVLDTNVLVQAPMPANALKRTAWCCPW